MDIRKPRAPTKVREEGVARYGTLLVPPALVERPKRGFAVPIAEWLRGPLRAWAESLLDETRLRQEGFFETAKLRQRWREHLAGKRDWSIALWHALMFQAWLDQQRVERSPAEKFELAV